VEFDSPAAAAEKIKELGDDGTMFIWSAHMKEDRLDESNLENELGKGDDGWVEIGQPVGESKPVELEGTDWKEISDEAFLAGKFKVGDVVSWKDENDEIQDGWTVAGYDEISMEYHLKKDDKDVFVDDVRVEE
jgi:hypothetical protein